MRARSFTPNHNPHFRTRGYVVTEGDIGAEDDHVKKANLRELEKAELRENIDKFGEMFYAPRSIKYIEGWYAYYLCARVMKCTSLHTISSFLSWDYFLQMQSHTDTLMLSLFPSLFLSYTHSFR